MVAAGIDFLAAVSIHHTVANEGAARIDRTTDCRAVRLAPCLEVRPIRVADGVGVVRRSVRVGVANFGLGHTAYATHVLGVVVGVAVARACVGIAADHLTCCSVVVGGTTASCRIVPALLVGAIRIGDGVGTVNRTVRIGVGHRGFSHATDPAHILGVVVGVAVARACGGIAPDDFAGGGVVIS